MLCLWWFYCIDFDIDLNDYFEVIASFISDAFFSPPPHMATTTTSRIASSTIATHPCLGHLNFIVKGYHTYKLPVGLLSNCYILSMHRYVFLGANQTRKVLIILKIKFRLSNTAK
jgi:hypothetical protein